MAARFPPVRAAILGLPFFLTGDASLTIFCHAYPLREGNLMNIQKTVTVQVSRHFDAPAENVFDAWLDPIKAGQFLFKTSAGKMLQVDIDARIGGKFCIIEQRGDAEAEHLGEYLEISRPR